jgi:outer membrane protein TolC
MLGALLLLSACRRFTREAADAETYGVLRCHRGVVPEVAGSLDVDAADRVAEAQRHPRRLELTVEKALAVAARASRRYLTEREDVYLAALALTGARNEFRPQGAAGGTGELLATEEGMSAAGSADVSVSRAFEQGGSLVLGLAFDVLEGLDFDNPLAFAQSVLQADLFVPLLRGSGIVAREALTQTERDTFYALRDYARFQQEFTVEVASAYFRVLQARDTWRNEERTHASLRLLLDRQEALGAEFAGRIPEFEVDQTRQDLLSADVRRTDAKAAYEGALDRLKLDLGIPVDTEVLLSDEDLALLKQLGPLVPAYGEEEAVRTAVERRLDLKNSRGRYQDALRHALVAKDGLKTQLDLRIGTGGTGPTDRPVDFEDLVLDGLVGLDLDLPLERTTERNQFRAALIEASRQRRAAQGLRDQVTGEVREAWRELDRARRNLTIQEEGVRLAERRVDSTNLLLEAGEATTRDRLDAENALVRARNAVTAALVDLAVARLGLERDVGLLKVRPDATWVPPDAPPPAGAGTPPGGGASPPAGPPASD